MIQQRSSGTLGLSDNVRVVYSRTVVPPGVCVCVVRTEYSRCTRTDAGAHGAARGEAAVSAVGERVGHDAGRRARAGGRPCALAVRQQGGVFTVR